MRKTKIICTLGPSTDQEGVLRELVANGMNVARFNFSHGSHEEHLGRFEKLKAIREELGKPVAALLDTKGPEIRLKDFKNGTEMLEAGQTFTLTTREVEGTSFLIFSAVSSVLSKKSSLILKMLISLAPSSAHCT